MAEVHVLQCVQMLGEQFEYVVLVQVEPDHLEPTMKPVCPRSKTNAEAYDVTIADVDDYMLCSGFEALGNIQSL